MIALLFVLPVLPLALLAGLQEKERREWWRGSERPRMRARTQAPAEAVGR